MFPGYKAAVAWLFQKVQSGFGSEDIWNILHGARTHVDVSAIDKTTSDLDDWAMSIVKNVRDGASGPLATRADRILSKPKTVLIDETTDGKEIAKALAEERRDAFATSRASANFSGIAMGTINRQAFENTRILARQDAE